MLSASAPFRVVFPWFWASRKPEHIPNKALSATIAWAAHCVQVTGAAMSQPGS